MKPACRYSRVSDFLRASAAAAALAAALHGASAYAEQPAVAAATGGSATTGGDDIIVTANKRSESVRKISASVIALSGDELDKIGAQSFKDYLAGLPGVQFQQSTPGVSNVTMRGIGTATIYPDQGQATTGIYVNDVPVTDPGFALSVPDLDVFDVKRVEVLKGPQGTLFGSAALGGAVNYIYNPVSLTDWQGRAQASVYATQGGDELGYTVKGAINVPVIKDVFGLRVAAVRRSDPGYLDNIGTGQTDTNTHSVTAFRVNALWKIAEGFNLSYFFLHDRAYNGDGFYSFPALGTLVRDTLVDEKAIFTTRIHNVKLDGDIGFAALTVSLADVYKVQDSISDESPFFGEPSYSPAHATDHSQVAELRLTSPNGRRFEWLVGAYYGRTTEYYPTPTYAIGGDLLDDFVVNYVSHEKAAFGEATYHLTDTLKINGGGRYYDIDLTTGTSDSGPGEDTTIAGGRQKQHGFSPKASITYTPSNDFMIYGLASRGFRMGGVNLNPQIASFPTPATYGSDSVWNYEIGTRISLFDKALTIDSTVFYVVWNGIQLRLARPDGRSYVANAGSAHNFGIENAVTWRPSHTFDLHAGVTYLSAKLAQTLDLGNGTVLEKGTALPGASRWTTSESATYHLDLPHQPYVMVDHRYISGATDDFDPTLPVGNYNTFGLRVGAVFGKFSAQAFVTNLTNKRGVTASEYFGAPLTSFYLQPRTGGISVEWSL